MRDLIEWSKLMIPKRNLKHKFNADSGEYERVLSPGCEYATVYGTGSGNIIGNVGATKLMTVTSGKKALVTFLLVCTDGVADDVSIEENGDQLGGGTSIWTLLEESITRTGATGHIACLTGTEEDPVLEIAEGDCDFGSQGNDTVYITMTYKEVNSQPN